MVRREQTPVYFFSSEFCARERYLLLEQGLESDFSLFLSARRNRLIISNMSRSLQLPRMSGKNLDSSLAAAVTSTSVSLIRHRVVNFLVSRHSESVYESVKYRRTATRGPQFTENEMQLLYAVFPQQCPSIVSAGDSNRCLMHLLRTTSAAAAGAATATSWKHCRGR